MITIICGQPRAGKTALMTSFAVPNMRGVAAHHDLRDCRKLLRPLNANGFNYQPPSDHLVYADYTILADLRGTVRPYEVDGFYLGLANDQHPTMFLPPCSRIYLDEAQKYFNSREKGLADFVSRFYELHGHYRLKITVTVQRPKLIDLNIRELSAKVLYVEKLEHAKEYGRIVTSEWTCISWDNVAAAISYIDGGFSASLRGDTVRHNFTGNIFRHYDSYNFFPAFLNERYDSPYDLRHAVVTGTTRDEIQDFNDQHDYTIPDTYYKPKGGKPKGGDKNA